MAAATYETYRDALLARHQDPLVDRLSTVGDVLMLAGLIAFVKNRRAGLRGFGAGLTVAAVAHLFDPATLRDEIVQVVSHPIWAVRADAHRIFRRA